MVVTDASILIAGWHKFSPSDCLSNRANSARYNWAHVFKMFLLTAAIGETAVRPDALVMRDALDG